MLEIKGEACDRDEVVRQILRRSSELIRGAGALGQENNSVALGILARAVVENWILLLWAEKSEENAQKIGAIAYAELAKATRINLEAGKLRIVNYSTGAEVTEEFLTSNRFKKLTKPTVESQAQEAGVVDIYTVFYRYLSLEVHGHSLGETRGNDDCSNSLALMHLIGAFGKSTGFVAVHWFLGRQRPDNEALRESLGL